ncbi:MAG: polynucleotide adenylyltransferase PcnB [Gammaproteobacteria bacterium]|nr:polynucleotide adenylyltransferase PcnB [Gammaproteobacteria bacterium]
MTRKTIGKAAYTVLEKLDDAGYEAFLVGGSVRDILLGRQPKDFDVATNAHPEEVKELFRRCRLVGRRFRLAHVRVGRDIIEVATFRAASNDPHMAVANERINTDAGAQTMVVSEGGQLIRDNIYGDIHQDIWRRDFTVNALYYDFSDGSIWDFGGGMHDIRAKVLRVIGDPEKRLREDPVRMLRAARFAAKLNFDIAPDTERAILANASRLDSISPARLFDELMKLFHHGYAIFSHRKLVELELFAHLIPIAEPFIKNGSVYEKLWLKALASTDSRIERHKSVTPAFLLAVVLWGPMRALADEMVAEGVPPIEALNRAAGNAMQEMRKRISVPRRFSLGVRDITTMQPRFDRRIGRRAMRLLEHPRFRAAYDFLCLRAEVGDAEQELVDWWTKIQNLPRHEQVKMTRPPRRQKKKNNS